MSGNPRRIYEFEDFRLDALKRQLTRAGQVVPLTSRAFDLLLVLVQSNGRDVTKDELLDQVWPGQVLEESNLPVNISAIRRALGEKTTEPRYLLTIPGRGYRFIARVQEVTDALVIESRTISQITVEEESDQRESLAVGASLESNRHVELDHHPAQQLIGQSSRRRFGKPIVIALVAVALVGLVVVSVFAVRAIKRNRLAANRFFWQIKLRPLTNDGGVMAAALSPDGRFYALVHSEKTGGKQSLQLGQVNGQAPVELRAPERLLYRQVEFSPDGNSVYYTVVENGHSVLYKLPVLGGVPVKLREGTGAHFSVSPNDQHVAFFKTNTANKTKTFLISNFDGSNERELLTVPITRGLGSQSSWSPDSSMIALSAFPESTQAAAGLFLLESATGKMRPFSRPLWREIWRTTWLKDGSGVLVIARGAGDDNRQVWLVEYPSGDERRLTNDLIDYDVVLSLASDSNQFLTTQYQQSSNIWVAPSEDFSKARQLTFATSSRQDGVAGLDWTPDGRIVYVAQIANDGAIWIMDADGKNAKALTPAGATDAIAPGVTADGRFVIFESNRNDSTDIWRVGIDGSDLKQLTTCGANSRPVSSPDGKWIVYRSTCDPVGGLWRMSIDGGDLKRLTDISASWPTISADGKWIACRYAEGPATKLAIIPIEGGAPVKLFDLAELANSNLLPKWTSDGKAIVYRDWGAGLWRQSIEGGPPEKISAIADEKIYGYSYSRDGKVIAFTRGAEIRDAVLISNAP